ncbi:protein Mo25-like [Anopheles stephensi]|uniref:protein Mo25-like n=1 Tax=Anopheles stephensi TaxID=30069 RepID=UPI001658A23E|nr:protein Mo25-like [Anopheles stephensi]
MLKLLFKHKKTAEEIVQKVGDGLVALDRGGQQAIAANESISRNLIAMKKMVYKTSDSDEYNYTMSQLSQQLYKTHLFLLLIKNLHRLQFEARKDVVQVFINVLIREIGARLPTVDYICSKPTILHSLLDGYRHRETVFSCGTMLRECAMHEPLANIMLNSAGFYTLFDYIAEPAFETSCDAFSTLSALLTNHPVLSAKFLTDNYEQVFKRYELLLKSTNYVTRRQSLKLLSGILLTPQNYHVMMKYVGREQNLKIIMNMLKDKSRHIQYEAFHVFKVFAANPEKPKEIRELLLRNKQPIVHFLARLLPTMENDEEFVEEKAYVIDKIKQLKQDSANK